MATATTGFAIGMDGHENTGSTFWTVGLLPYQFPIFNAILGPLC